jgi:hypothetical protein
MATEKRFAVAGVSTHNGATKVRFANDAARVKILVKNGHTDIELVDLPHEMTKAEIAQYMHEQDFARGRVAVMDAIKDLAKKNRVKAVPAVNTATTTTAGTAEAVAQ